MLNSILVVHNNVFWDLRLHGLIIVSPPPPKISFPIYHVSLRFAVGHSYSIFNNNIANIIACPLIKLLLSFSVVLSVTAFSQVD